LENKVVNSQLEDIEIDKRGLFKKPMKMKIILKKYLDQMQYFEDF